MNPVRNIKSILLVRLPIMLRPVVALSLNEAYQISIKQNSDIWKKKQFYRIGLQLQKGAYRWNVTLKTQKPFWGRLHRNKPRHSTYLP